MKKLIVFILCLLAINSPAPSPFPVVPIGLANPRFGIVHTMHSTDYVAIEIKGVPHGIPLSDFVTVSGTNGTVTINVLNFTSNTLVTIINATNAALIADVNAMSNFLYGVSLTNTTVSAGTNVVVDTNTVGIQTTYKISVATNAFGGGGGESLWTNEAGVVHLKTNGPITLGTNNSPVATPFYVLSLVSNDSMSGAQIEFVPISGTATSRAGLDIFMDTGDSLGGFSYDLWGMNTATSSNRFGAYFGNVPFGLIGVASSSGTGDAGGVIGIAEGDTKGTGYGVQGLTDGSNTTNKLVGVFGSGSTNSGGAAGGYFELGDGYATVTDTHPEMSALIADSRKTGFPIFTGRTNNGYTVFQLLSTGHAQLNSNDLYSVTAGTGITLATNGTTLTISGTDTNIAGNTNISGILASNNVRVAAGANITVATNGSGGQMIYTVAGSITPNFDSITVTNAYNRIRSLVPSTTLTTQIDFATGPTAYYWTNMVTNITLQVTNTWVGSVSNRVLDFFFTGATNNGPNYTVTFSCPDVSGLVFRWGTYSATNGGNAFAVTNNSGAGVSLTLWDTNLIEAYYSPTR